MKDDKAKKKEKEENFDLGKVLSKVKKKQKDEKERKRIGFQENGQNRFNSQY